MDNCSIDYICIHGSGIGAAAILQRILPALRSAPHVLQCSAVAHATAHETSCVVVSHVGTRTSMSGIGRAPEARATHERGGGDSTSARKPRKKKAHKRHKRSSKDKKRHRHREPRNKGRRDDHTTRPKKRRRRRVLSSSSDSDPLSASEFFSSFTPRTVSPPVANTIPAPAREPWSAATRQVGVLADLVLGTSRHSLVFARWRSCSWQRRWVWWRW